MNAKTESIAQAAQASSPQLTAMENPDHLSSDAMSILIARSTALTAIGIGDFLARAHRPIVHIHTVQPTTDASDGQEFLIISTRGEPGTPTYQRTVHGSLSCKVFDDGYNNAVQLGLNVMTPL